MPEPSPPGEASQDEGPAGGAPQDAAPAGQRKSFREAFRTFAHDGGYLLSFPARTNARGVWLTAGFVAGTVWLIDRDEAIRRHVIESDRTTPGRVATKFEPLGREAVEMAGVGIFYWAARASHRPEAVQTAATTFEALLWSGLIAMAAKGIFGRKRPTGDNTAHEWFTNDTIFPSGRTTRSFAMAAVLADRYGRKGASIAYPVAALIGLSTVQRDLHWASDVLAGAGLGLAVGHGIVARHPARGGAVERGGAAPVSRQARAIDWQISPAPGGAFLRVAF